MQDTQILFMNILYPLDKRLRCCHASLLRAEIRVSKCAPAVAARTESESCFAARPFPSRINDDNIGAG